jgi:hypothetical protein
MDQPEPAASANARTPARAGLRPPVVAAPPALRPEPARGMPLFDAPARMREKPSANPLERARAESNRPPISASAGSGHGCTREPDANGSQGQRCGGYPSIVYGGRVQGRHGGYQIGPAYVLAPDARIISIDAAD